MKPLVTVAFLSAVLLFAGRLPAVDDQSPLGEKAEYLLQDLLDKHWLDGLYISIVPSAPHGTTLPHTVDEPGNVIHAGVWTGRYLGGVGYEYAVTKDPKVRERGGQILKALRILQEVTGKPGLLARGYVKGHGPVMDWERDGADSKEWHQGQGAYADYRWYGDVSVDNFNAVLYGYAIYYDLAADDAQKKYIAHDVDRLMTHLVDNHCRIVDVDGEPTEWGHVGIDPDPSRDEYYQKIYERRMKFFGITSVAQSPLRGSLMLLPDLLIAHRITGKDRYIDLYRKVVARYKGNPEPEFFRRKFSLESLARVDHSSEGQSYEALYNLIRYEKDPELLKIYSSWVAQLWDWNWGEGNTLFTYMTHVLLPDAPHAEESMALANRTLALYPIDRVMRPVMNSLRKDLELNPHKDPEDRAPQAARPLPINERPLDNEYAWKANPYRLDGWPKPGVVAMQFACDDPQVAWFCDSAGRVYRTLDRGKSWRNVSGGTMGVGITGLSASRSRTFVLWGKTVSGALVTRDGGLSWRNASEKDEPSFPRPKFQEWLAVAGGAQLRIDDAGQLVRSLDGGKTEQPAMEGWRIPRANSFFTTPWGVIASGPGGVYRSDDGQAWEEQPFFREQETGPADYLHAYWMGRYYGFVAADGEVSKPLPAKQEKAGLNSMLEKRCLEILRGGLNSKEFWPSMHAAEALTVSGHGDEVLAALRPRTETVRDDRERCGVARELVRAGDRMQLGVLFEVLAKENDYGHVHASESLFKIRHIGDGTLMRKKMEQTAKVPLQLMAAAALAKCGDPDAVKVVRTRLADGDSEARRIAAWLVSQIGDESDSRQLQANIAAEQDPVKRAYAENALSVVDGAEFRKLLDTNLQNASDEIRALGAMAAVDARRTDLSSELEKMLDDPILDVRLRAAQALLSLAQPEQKSDVIVRDVYPATKMNPRYSEGSVIVLMDGSILFATTEFIDSNSDFAKARIIARTSQDGGLNWSEPRVLQENVGGKNVMSATLRRLPADGSGKDRIGLFYLIKNDFNDLKAALRVSTDEAKTFGPPTIITDAPGYHVLNNDRITTLSTGRILVPVASTADVEKENHFVCRCWYSDDGGKSWRQGKGSVDQPKRGAMEPEVIETKDGKVLMIIRTQLGHIAASVSSDAGDTWGEPKPWGVRSPESPATLRRIPATGDLVLIWNDTYEEGTGHGGKRTPLTAAVSKDEGKTWSHVRNIETDKNHTYAYTSLLFDKDRALLSYYVADEKTGNISNRFRSLPVRWFYEASR